MRVRHDVVFVSSVLFTVALLYLVPIFLNLAETSVDNMIQSAGFASLANIFVGLTVIWTGYFKRVRSAWFVMLIIVGVWAFPILVLPYLQNRMGLTLAEWTSQALKERGPARYSAEEILAFSLMVIALILPIKSFFWGYKENANP